MAIKTHRNALAPGYRLHWYEIQSILGQGGFGITYLALDTNLRQPVAIKEFLPSDLATRSEDSTVHPISEGHGDTFGWGLNRFLIEAQTLAQFRHPNIVRVYSVFESNGTAYMVMEYESGASLEDALKFGRVKGEDALLAILHALLDGLALVHEAGFIHRDIKPENVYLRDDGTPVLLDFGSARQALGVATRTLTSLVTPGYAPFEQYQATRENDKQGPWTDIYSLAATMYRAVTGRGPVDAVTRADSIIGDGVDPYAPIAGKAREGYSEGFLEAIDAALAFQPRERPQTIAAWRALLPERPRKTATGGHRQAVAADAGDEAPTELADDDIETEAAPASAESGRAHAAEPQAAKPTPRRRAAVVAVPLAVLAAAGVAGWLAYRSQDAGSIDAPDPGEKTVVAARAPAGDESGDATDSASRRRSAAADDDPTRDAGTAPQPLEDERARLERERAEQEESARLAAQVRREREEAERLAALEREREAEQRRRAAEREAEIERLLSQASADIEALRLTTPSEANAYDRLQRVLALDPGNAEALDGISRVADRYVALASRASSEGRLDDAARFLDRAHAVQPDSAAVRAAREEIARLRRERRLEEEARREARAEAPTGGDASEPAPGAAPETVAAAAPPAGPITFAVFPFQSIVSCYYAVGEEVISAARQRIGEHGGADLRYSFYDKALRDERMPRPREVWNDNMAHREPVVDKAIEAGERLGVDGVLMAWYRCNSNMHMTMDTYDVELHLIDVESGEVYRGTDNLLDAERLTNELFDRFFAARSG